MLVNNHLVGFDANGKDNIIMGFAPSVTPFNSDGWPAYTFCTTLSRASVVMPPAGATNLRARVRLRSGTNQPATFTKIGLGLKAASGDAWDQSYCAQMFVGGSAAHVLATDSVQYTDWVSFTDNGTADIMFSVYCGDATGNADSFWATSEGIRSYRSGDECLTLNRATGGTWAHGSVQCTGFDRLEWMFDL